MHPKEKNQTTKNGRLDLILPSRLDWPSLIGQFLLNFGTLECVVFTFLENQLPREEFEQCRNWHLKDRLSRIERHMRERGYPEDQQLAFSKALERLKEVREIRNDLAHSHLLLRPDPMTNKLAIRVFNPKHFSSGLEESLGYDFDDILHAQDALSACIEKLGRILAQPKPTGS